MSRRYLLHLVLCLSVLFAVVSCKSDVETSKGKAALEDIKAEPSDSADVNVAPPIDREGDLVATLSLPLQVGARGDATTRLSFVLPPGTGGISPNLGLAYSSHDGGSIVGVGWKLTGLSRIDRCGATVGRDGYLAGVRFESLGDAGGDRYCLDGAHLIAVNGVYGANGTEYRTEHESFIKVMSLGSSGAGPLSFEVRYPNGVVSTFGATEDARIQAGAPETPTVRAWLVDRVQDVSGNYYAVHYDEDASGDRAYVYPTSIAYTGNATLGMPPYNEVKFEYEQRPDIMMGYRHGTRLVTTRRLSAISAFAENALVSRYRLVYETSSDTDRSLLTEVTRCVPDGRCLRPTRIRYGGSPEPLDLRPPSLGATNYIPAQWQNGSTVPGRSSFARVDPNLRREAEGSQTELPHYRTDLDGDGRDEMLRVEISDRNVLDAGNVVVVRRYHVFQALGLTANGTGISDRVIGDINVDTANADYSELITDHDGDGVADVVTLQMTETPINGPGSPKIATLRAVVSSSSGGQLQPVLPAGLPLNQQWVNPYVGQQAQSQKIFWNLVPGLVGPAAGASQEETRMRAEGLRILTGDVTGDGRDDLVVIGYAYPDDTRGYIWLFESKGDGTYGYVSRTDAGTWNPMNVHYVSGHWSDNPSLGRSPGDQWLLADMDGDGRVDVLQVRHDDNDGSEALVAWRAVAQGWPGFSGSGVSTVGFAATSATQILGVGQGYDGAAYGRHRYIAEDVNGDGLTDMVVVRPSSLGNLLDLSGDVWISTGKNYVASSLGMPLGSAAPVAAPADPVGVHVMSAHVDGDGRSDLILVRKCSPMLDAWCADLYVSRGEPARLDFRGTRRVAGTGTGGPFHRGVSFAGLDLNGDGLTDLTEIGTSLSAPLPIWNGTWLASDVVYFSADVQVAKMPDLLVRAEDAFGAWNQVTHKSLLEPGMHVRGTSAVYPIRDVSRPVYVVGSRVTDVGLANPGIEYLYSYEGLRYDALRRESLGFSAMNEVRTQLSQSLRVEFEQSAPSAGLARNRTLRDTQGNLQASTENTYVTTPTGNAQPYVEYHTPGSTQGSLRLWNAAGVNFTARPQFTTAAASTDVVYLYDGPSLVGRTVSSRYETRGGFGELVEEGERVFDLLPGGIRELTTKKNQYLYAHDVANWRLAHRTRADYTVSDASTSFTRTSFATYDALGRLNGTIDNPGQAPYESRTALVRDSFGNVVTSARGASGTARFDVTTYDARGRFPRTSTNALGHTTSYEFDARFGVPTKVTDPNGVVDTFIYDALGRSIRHSNAASGLDVRTQRLWATNGAPSSAVTEVRETETGHSATFAFKDRLGRDVERRSIGFDGTPIVGTLAYDALGRLAANSVPFALGAIPTLNVPSYDALNRVTSVAMVHGGTTLSTTTHAYHGFRTDTTNALGHLHVEEVDGLGRTLFSADGGGPGLTYSYDARGLVVRIGGAGAYEMDYDLLGRRVELRDPDMGTIRTAYDAWGQTTSETDANGQVASYLYDALGRRVSRTEQEGTTHWEWDSATNGIGELAWACGPSLAALSAGSGSAPIDCLGAHPRFRRDLAYDAAGRISNERVNMDGETFSRGLSYDAFGRLVRFDYPNPALGALAPLPRPPAVIYGYNAQGFLANATLDVDGVQSPLWRLDAGDALGHVTSEVIGAGVAVTSRTYDALGRLDALASGTSGPGSHDLQNLLYAHDALGNTMARADYNQVVPTGQGFAPAAESFQYDALNRLSTIDRTTSAGQSSVPHQYDALGNITMRGTGVFTYSPAHPHRLVT